MRDSAQIEITPELLLDAYASGIFPMADDAETDEIYWVDPLHRGVIPLDGFHISRSLARRLRQNDVRVTVNSAFLDVVRHCADRPVTWINGPIFDLYAKLHKMGFAHALEVWQEDRLIGGVYGVTLGGAFFGESMFSCARDGSKIALAYLVRHLKARGFVLFDTQFLTEHLASMGAVEIPRETYHDALDHALRIRALPFDVKGALPLWGQLQDSTQTS